MRVLGINTAHDSSVCIIENGKIIRYFKEERLSRIKKDSNPQLSIIEALKGINSIDVVAYCDVVSSDAIHNYIEIIKKHVDVYDVIDLSNDHHLQHASLGFYNSGFESANIIVVDRNGSDFHKSARESESIFYANYPHNFQSVYKNFWLYDNNAHLKIEEYKKNNPGVDIDIRSMYGIVKVYETATTLIEQHILENGKAMGLSAYGDKEKKYHNFFVNNTNIANDFYFGHKENEQGDYESINQDLIGFKNKNFTDRNVKIYADYAWQVQKQTQDAVSYLIEKAIEKNECKNIVLVGGYALNVVANQHFIEKFKECEFFFEPIADDSGTSIGGAYLAYRLLTKDKTINPLVTTNFHGWKNSIPDNIGKSCSIDDIVDLLLAQKSVAIFQGQAEAGPRALGNRSVLFDSRNKSAHEIVNKIKNREWYRPFAGMILKKDAEKYFEIKDIKNSKFMTVNFKAKDIALKDIPGILHVDSTSRIQIVEENDGVIYELLTAFKNKTGIGALLNTSFNKAGDPLVETVDNAIEMLETTDLDYVWFPEQNRLRGKNE